MSVGFIACQTDVKNKAVEETNASIPKPNSRENINLIPKDTINVGEFEFKGEMVYDFGTITEGEEVEHIFEFKNIGKVPLVIKNAVGSCGCTVPDWEKKPIPIGETSKIKVKFNSSGRKGEQKKAVTLTSNTYPVQTILYIKGKVNKK